MARLSYECDNSTKGAEDGDSVSPRPFPCAPEKYCFYCCCNPQCCFVIQRRAPKHFWEAWYFWLGVALLLIIVLSTVGTYVVTNCKQNLQAIGYSVSGGRNNAAATTSTATASTSTRSGQATAAVSARDPRLQLQQQHQHPNNRNEISINIIPTSAVMPTHRKIMFIAPQPSCAHLTPIVA